METAGYSLNSYSVDEGLLMVSNTVTDLKNVTDLEESLKRCASNCFQALILKLHDLKAEIYEEVVTYVLPEPVYELPRVRPILKAAPLTKWEKFAKEKGIRKKKKDKLLYDENTKEYRPRFGKNRINDPNDQWIIETPKDFPLGKDPFEIIETQKKEGVAKNELSRLKNLKNAGKKSPYVARVQTTPKKTKKHLKFKDLKSEKEFALNTNLVTFSNKNFHYLIHKKVASLKLLGKKQQQKSHYIFVFYDF
ncbi:hypothetical protein HZS_6913 [Henneguya salminicola]|nr:hypothetical protein HZS_6913 [Henneguya salminicola]